MAAFSDIVSAIAQWDLHAIVYGDEEREARYGLYNDGMKGKRRAAECDGHVDRRR